MSGGFHDAAGPKERRRVARVLLPVALVAALGGCSSALTRAGALHRQGRYLEAAAAYDERVRVDPEDEAARRGRAAARVAAVGELLQRAQEAAHRGQVAQGGPALRQALTLRREWRLHGDRRVAAAAATAVAEVERGIATAVLAPARAGHLLTARAVAQDLGATLRLAELAPLRQRLTQELAAAARTTCRRLGDRSRDPYWQVLVSRYCGHLGVATPPPSRVLPHHRRPPLIQGTVAGLAPGEAARLRRQIHEWVGASPWCAAGASAAAGGVVRGHTFVLISRKPVTLTKHWVQRVAYTAQETYQQPYQEAYTAMEHYTVQVPTTRTETYTYRCGSSTCTGTRSHTSYTSQSRSRSVTRYRTAYRTATRSVTRYRQVPRIYRYPAVAVTGEYRTELLVQLDLGGDLEPLKVRLAFDDQRSGHDHEARFAAAGVAPQRANVPGREAWLTTSATELRQSLEEALARHYREHYCQAREPSLEQAARCLWWGGPPPQTATAALATVLGPDAPRLGGILQEEQR